MSSYNKAKGSKFETDVMKYLRKLGHFAERLAKAGANDEGDIITIIAGQSYILECKNRKSINLPQFWAEAQTEAANYAKARGLGEAPPAFVIVKRRNASIEDAWVIQTLEKWIEQMPIPEGKITNSEILTTPEVQNEKTYKITFTRNSVKSTVVTASSKEEALIKAQFRVSGNANEYDELVQEFEPEIKEQE